MFTGSRTVVDIGRQISAGGTGSPSTVKTASRYMIFNTPSRISIPIGKATSFRRGPLAGRCLRVLFFRSPSVTTIIVAPSGAGDGSTSTSASGSSRLGSYIIDYRDELHLPAFWRDHGRRLRQRQLVPVHRP